MKSVLIILAFIAGWAACLYEARHHVFARQARATPSPATPRPAFVPHVTTLDRPVRKGDR